MTGLGSGLGSGQAETLRAPAGHQDFLRLGEDWVEMENNDDAELADMWPAGHRRRRLRAPASRRPGVPDEMATCGPSLTNDVYTGKRARRSHPARPR